MALDRSQTDSVSGVPLLGDLVEAIGRCSDYLTQRKGVGNHAFSYPLRLIIHRINEEGSPCCSESV